MAIIPKNDWKRRLYDAYVSSGQASQHVSSESLFHARAPAIKAMIAKHIPEDKELAHS